MPRNSSRTWRATASSHRHPWSRSFRLSPPAGCFPPGSWRRGSAVVRLHLPGVADAVGGRADANVAPTLLHDDAEDGAHVDAGSGRHRLDGFLDERDILLAVVELHESRVGLPKVRVRRLLLPGWEVGRAAGVLDVASAASAPSLRAWNAAAGPWTAGRSGMQVDDLADLELLGGNTGIGAENVGKGGVVAGCNGAQRIAGSDGVGAYV